MSISPKTKKVTAWALYDWANSGFATTVMAGFFPVFFKQYWSAESEAGVSTLQLGLGNSLASLLVVFLSPILGAIADKGSAKKRFLLFFTFLGVANTALLYLVARGEWQIAIVLYALAMIGFLGGLTFYDALLVSVAEKRELHRISALGYALGYLGGGLLFAFNVVMVQWPEIFGLQDAGAAVRLSFISVALWWAVFSLPIFFFVEEPRTPHDLTGMAAIREGLRELLATFKHIRQLRVVVLFLAAYFLYIDGIDTVALMAVDYGLSLGFEANSLIVALLITQFVGFPAAIVFGRIGERFGPKTGIFIALAVYIAVVIYAYTMQKVEEFYVLAAVIGLVQGAVQALSRSLYASIIPPQKAAEFFGFYNMWAKFSVVIGPALIGWVSVATGSPRYSILAVILLLLAGASLLYFVDLSKSRPSPE
jgi:MFS transporter, UMF1 family